MGDTVHNEKIQVVIDRLREKNSSSHSASLMHLTEITCTGTRASGYTMYLCL